MGNAAFIFTNPNAFIPINVEFKVSPADWRKPFLIKHFKQDKSTPKKQEHNKESEFGEFKDERKAFFIPSGYIDK